MRWIEITTNFPCTVGCSYCPQDVLRKVYKGVHILTLENFKKILYNIPRDVPIDFAGFSEPFLNPECPDMIIYANEQGYKILVDTTFTGISDSDINRISDIPFAHFGQHDIGLPLRDYPFIHRTIKVTEPLSRAGNLYPEIRRDECGVCSRSSLHTTNVMLPNGDVVLCCHDYALKHKLGNLFETNFNDLHRQDDYELCHYCPDLKRI